METSRIIRNAIKTPDGTVLESRHRHDFQQHIDSVSGETYFTDGGHDYARRSVNTAAYEDLTVYSDAPFEIIREAFLWGTYGTGKRRTAKPKLVKLSKLSNSHICNILMDAEHRNYDTSLFLEVIDYRKSKGIYIED